MAVRRPTIFAQRRRLVDVKIMNAVAVVAHGVIHVLNEIATERDIDDLVPRQIASSGR
jgi:hypothetical protein